MTNHIYPMKGCANIVRIHSSSAQELFSKSNDNGLFA